MAFSTPGRAGWLHRLLRGLLRRTLPRKLSGRTEPEMPSSRSALDQDPSAATAGNLHPTLFLGTAEKEQPTLRHEAVFARAALSVLARAIVHARALSELEDEAAEVRELLDAIHNIPLAIVDPHSYFGVHGEGHDRLLHHLATYEARWGRLPIRGRMTTTAASAVARSDRAITNASERSVRRPGRRPRASSYQILRWAAAATARAKQTLSGSQLRGHLRAFRCSTRDILDLSLHDELGHVHGISFTAGCEHSLDVVAPEVPDLVEALHMAGIVIRLLGASATVGDSDALEREIEAV